MKAEKKEKNNQVDERKKEKGNGERVSQFHGPLSASLLVMRVHKSAQ
jgi:hypothetical protein